MRAKCLNKMINRPYRVYYEDSDSDLGWQECFQERTLRNAKATVDEERGNDARAGDKGRYRYRITKEEIVLEWSS